MLDWIAYDSTKPGRNGDIVTWVVHARADWSRANLEGAAEHIAPELLQALTAYFDSNPQPVSAQAHRWRYAKVERAAGTAFGWDTALRIGACGDWRLGPRVELAWKSGHELAQAMLA